MVIQFVDDDENGCKNDCFGMIKEILLKYAFILYRYQSLRKKKFFFQLLKIKSQIIQVNINKISLHILKFS